MQQLSGINLITYVSDPPFFSINHVDDIIVCSRHFRRIGWTVP
jgi:hypothetical protein